MSATADPRRANGDPYPPEILFLAQTFELDPEFIMRNPHTYLARSGRAPISAAGDLDPDRFSE